MMKLTKKALTIALIIFMIGAFSDFAQAAKKYKFQLEDHYQIEQVRGSTSERLLIKAWATASNAKKAIEKAKQDAIAATIFGGSNAITPILRHVESFDEHRDYFEEFFTKGEYLNYVEEINSAFPTGENNIQTPEGRRVGILLIVYSSQLREKLEQDGIAVKMSDILNQPH